MGEEEGRKEEIVIREKERERGGFRELLVVEGGVPFGFERDL